MLIESPSSSRVLDASKLLLCFLSSEPDPIIAGIAVGSACKVSQNGFEYLVIKDQHGNDLKCSIPAGNAALRKTGSNNKKYHKDTEYTETIDSVVQHTFKMLLSKVQ